MKNQFVQAMRDQQCILQPDEVKAHRGFHPTFHFYVPFHVSHRLHLGLLWFTEATRFTLGGGGHGISDCQAACHAQAQMNCFGADVSEKGVSLLQADCGYLVFYERTGFCHMFRTQLGDAEGVRLRSEPVAPEGRSDARWAQSELGPLARRSCQQQLPAGDGAVLMTRQ